MRITPTQSYPRIPGQQFLCIVDTSEVKPPFADTLGRIHWKDLSRTVLAGAFIDDCTVTMDVDGTTFDLPKLQRKELREERVYDQHGNYLGVLLNVPALFVHANNIIYRRKFNDPEHEYDYNAALRSMAVETGRLAAGEIDNIVFSNREPYGFYGPIICSEVVSDNEIAITERFAIKIVKGIIKKNPNAFGTNLTEEFLTRPIRKLNKKQRQFLKDLARETLDGFPCWSSRYPIANRYGVSKKIVRVVEGVHNAVIVNPVFLVQRYLGDADGDQLFNILRINDVNDGKITPRKLEPIQYSAFLNGTANSRLTLENALNPKTLDLSDKQSIKWLTPNLTSTESRLVAIQDADTKSHVAVYTIMAWWIARILITKGNYDFYESCRLAFDVLEWYMETAMDTRKGGSSMSTVTGFNPYKHMQDILYGGEMDWDMLRLMGIPKESLDVMQLVWRLADNNLRACCAESAVYDATILRRKSPIMPTVRLFDIIRNYGYQPEDITNLIVKDLLGENILKNPIQTTNYD